MASDEKYSLPEAGLMLAGVPVAFVVVVFLIGLPLGLLSAWIRATIWNWFAVPYLHLPHISVWVDVCNWLVYQSILRQSAIP